MSLAPTASEPQYGATLRRLSSHEANHENMDLRAPTIVVPPSQLDTPGEGQETAAAMEVARYNLEDALSEHSAGSELQPTLSRELSREMSRDSRVTDKYAFAFDIDGVLIRGGRPIPEAIEAMKVLNGKNPYGIKIPYIFVTNGGGKTEQERCVQLSKQLELEVSPGQFICGHTPMREMVEQYNTVLVVGGEGEKCRQVAETYGFKDIVTPGDIIKDNPHTTPFRSLTEQELENSKLRNYGKVKIEAILVFADSRDWAGDQQIILDLLTSKGGYLGTRSENFDEGPPLFFAHNDIIWSAQHDHTRLGMGALRLSLEAMYHGITGKKLEATSFGKPQIGTFEFATRLLQQWRKENSGIDAPPETVYFVGDTPESDIRGSNLFNEHSANEWYSILVRTGVYDEGTTPKFTPKATVDNVLQAVLHAIEREKNKDTMKWRDEVSSQQEALRSTHAVDWAARGSMIST